MQYTVSVMLIFCNVTALSPQLNSHLVLHLCIDLQHFRCSNATPIRKIPILPQIILSPCMLCGVVKSTVWHTCNMYYIGGFNNREFWLSRYRCVVWSNVCWRFLFGYGSFVLLTWYTVLATLNKRHAGKKYLLSVIIIPYMRWRHQSQYYFLQFSSKSCCKLM